jgi:hypothetical protein
VVKVKGDNVDVKLFSVHMNGKDGARTWQWDRVLVQQWLQPRESDISQTQYTSDLFDM